MPSLRPYPSYRNTDLPWIAQIPTHWDVKRIKQLARQKYKSFVDGNWIESPYIVQDEGVRLIQTGNIGIGRYKEQGYRYITEETFRKLDCTEFFPGDILICRLAEPVGRACLAPDLGTRMITSVDVCILKPQYKYDSKYIVYFLSSDAYLNWLTVLSRGSTRDRISRSMLGDIHIATPPLPEQQAIAAYLDRQTAKIDALIAKKERLLDLLAEQRAALISQAVTKGLNPNVKMKDSGMAWLGQVSSYWKIKKLKSMCSTTKGFAFKSEIFTDEGIPVVRASEIKGFTVLPCSTFISSDIADHFKKVELHSGDIIISTVGSKAEVVNSAVGQIAIVPTELDGALLNQNTVRLKVKSQDDISNEFLGYVFMTDVFRKYLDIHAHGTANQASLNVSDILDFSIPIPSLPEQKEIVEYLDYQTKRLSGLAGKVEIAIERLREYRAALISSVVTGKVDIRKGLKV